MTNLNNDLIEKRKAEARRKRYKKALCKDINLKSIQTFLAEAQEDASEVGYAVQNDDVFVEALGGDEQEAEEFRTAYDILCGDIERFSDDLQEAWVPDCFDDLLAACAPKESGLMGYDEYETDYYGLEDFDDGPAREECRKRLARMTKTELIDATQQCIKVAVSYLGIKGRYEDLGASLAIIRAQNDGIVGAVTRIEELYDKTYGCDPSERNYPLCREFDSIAAVLPAECWLR